VINSNWRAIYEIIKLIFDPPRTQAYKLLEPPLWIFVTIEEIAFSSLFDIIFTIFHFLDVVLKTYFEDILIHHSNFVTIILILD